MFFEQVTHDYETFDVERPGAAQVSSYTLSEDQQAVYDAMEKWLNAATHSRGKPSLLTLGGYAGTGKGQPLDACVMTPFGEKPMGSMKVGSLVSNPDGSTARVIGVFELGVRDIYKVSFSDGASTRVTLDHLWLVKRAGKHLKAERRDMNGAPLWGRIETTESLIKYIEQEKVKERKFLPLVPLTNPVSLTMWNRSAAPLDPYVLGVLLGDGGLTGATPMVSSIDLEIVSSLEKVLACSLKTSDGVSYRIPIGTGVKSKLQDLDLYGKYSYEKEIPRRYMCGTKAERFALVQGLMDTDGTVDSGGIVSFCSTSRRMVEQLRWVLFTLGFRVSMSSKIPTYRSTKSSDRLKGREAYILHIQGRNLEKLFRLSRKISRCPSVFNGGSSEVARRMISIERDGREEARCIAVDHPNSLYITDDCIVTHNTTLMAKLINDHPEARFTCAAFTGKAANNLGQKIGSPVSTIHRMIYKPSFNDEISESEEVKFVIKERGEVSIGVVGLDEASMVDAKTYADIESFGRPILAVGDHGQLPPIDGPSVLMENPMLRLEKIHRQAEGSAIIQLSKMVRERGSMPMPPPFGIRHLSFRMLEGELTERLGSLRSEDFHNFAVLCYMNHTRVKVNAIVRRARFGEDALDEKPYVGDVLVCLRNQRPIYNGMRGTLQKINRCKGPTDQMEVVFPDDGILHRGPVVRAQFGREKTFNTAQDLREVGIKAGRDVREVGAYYDYGYCMTVHKSQGSGFKTVYLIREKPSKITDDEYLRWVYTGITRAVDELVIVAR